MFLLRGKNEVYQTWNSNLLQLNYCYYSKSYSKYSHSVTLIKFFERHLPGTVCHPGITLQCLSFDDRKLVWLIYQCNLKYKAVMLYHPPAKPSTKNVSRVKLIYSSVMMWMIFTLQNVQRLSSINYLGMPDSQSLQGVHYSYHQWFFI